MQSGRRLEASKASSRLRKWRSSGGVRQHPTVPRGNSNAQVLVTSASLSPNMLNEVVVFPARKRKLDRTWKIKGLSLASVKLTILPSTALRLELLSLSLSFCGKFA